MGSLRGHSIVVSAACILVLLAAASAGAQTPNATGLLTAAAAKDTTVYVLDSSGQVSKGRLIDVADGALHLRLEDQSRRIPLVDVARVDTRDRLRNGALIGGLVGLALWFVPMMAEGERCSISCVPAGGYAFAIGAGLGALIDLAIAGRETLYEAPRARPDGFGSTNRHGVAVAWRF